jgi:hypothetical protein
MQENKKNVLKMNHRGKSNKIKKKLNSITSPYRYANIYHKKKTFQMSNPFYIKRKTKHIFKPKQIASNNVINSDSMNIIDIKTVQNEPTSEIISSINTVDTVQCINNTDIFSNPLPPDSDSQLIDLEDKTEILPQNLITFDEIKHDDFTASLITFEQVSVEKNEKESTSEKEMTIFTSPSSSIQPGSSSTSRGMVHETINQIISGSKNVIYIAIHYRFNLII